MADTDWPPLPLQEWQPTYETLHRYTQVVGKVRLALEPMRNQWWQVPLYVTARGLTTSAMPHGDRTLQVDFDLLDHRLVAATSDGQRRRLPLGASVREFYRDTMALLAALDAPVGIWATPVEVPDPVPFDEDERDGYDPAHAHRYFEVLRRVDSVFTRFRSRFTGKCSPVHFFWGAFDLAVTRFSGRPADPPSDADRVTRLGYNAELSSLGFWPGGAWPGAGTIDTACFYSYTHPEPAGFRRQRVRPEGAAYDEQLGEFTLSYDIVREDDDPEASILEFAQTTYEAGARLQGWPMEELELRADSEAQRMPPEKVSELAASKAPNTPGR